MVLDLDGYLNSFQEWYDKDIRLSIVVLSQENYRNF